MRDSEVRTDHEWDFVFRNEDTRLPEGQVACQLSVVSCQLSVVSFPGLSRRCINRWVLFFSWLTAGPAVGLNS
jgi:hypothetical protein